MDQKNVAKMNGETAVFELGGRTYRDFLLEGGAQTPTKIGTALAPLFLFFIFIP